MSEAVVTAQIKEIESFSENDNVQFLSELALKIPFQYLYFCSFLMEQPTWSSQPNETDILYSSAPFQQNSSSTSLVCSLSINLAGRTKLV